MNTGVADGHRSSVETGWLRSSMGRPALCLVRDRARAGATNASMGVCRGRPAIWSGAAAPRTSATTLPMCGNARGGDEAGAKWRSEDLRNGGDRVGLHVRGFTDRVRTKGTAARIETSSTTCASSPGERLTH